MTKLISKQLRFPTVAGMSVRAHFDGGSMSSDFGALLLAGVDRQTGLTERLASSFTDLRHGSYVAHDLVDLFKQRIYQQASSYEDCNDANVLREDPMFKLAVGRSPLGESNPLASQPTFSRLSGKLITAILRPGKRPTGKENAMIMKRVLTRIRHQWPNTKIILRGDGHFSNPELMQLCIDDANMDFIFGLPSNKVINRLALPLMQKARALHICQQAYAKGLSINNTRLFGEFEYAAGSWPKAFRVIHKLYAPDHQLRSL